MDQTNSVLANLSGTVRYTTTFDLPALLPASCIGSLGEVANTARVSLKPPENRCQIFHRLLRPLRSRGENRRI